MESYDIIKDKTIKRQLHFRWYEDKREEKIDAIDEITILIKNKVIAID